MYFMKYLSISSNFPIKTWDFPVGHVITRGHGSSTSQWLAVVDVLHKELHRLAPPTVLGHVSQRWLSEHAVLNSELDPHKRQF
jgi:hypothetical protein